MITIDKIRSVFAKNYPREVRDAVWNNCMATAMKEELTEQNLENMCGTALVTGFGGGGGKEEVVNMAQALGIFGIENPESNAFYGCRYPPKDHMGDLTMDQVLDRIQDALPFPLKFPPFSGNCRQGLKTKYGVTSNRHMFYLWVMKRIMELCSDRSSSIIEIGAGFGILAYYMELAGYKDYTSIDLALINACQTYFLSRNLPNRDIILSGDVQNPFEDTHKAAIKLLHATDFSMIPDGRYDILVNMDGITEMGIAEASKYIHRQCAPMFLSINHEVNPFRVCEIAQPSMRRVYRYPFWLRPGYVEELYERI